MPKRYLIAGVGSVLRGDDGVGIKALGYLKAKLNHQDFDFLEFATQSFDILNYIKQYHLTFIIDAVNFGMPAGHVRSFSLEDINLGAEKNNLSSHAISLNDLLKLYKTLGIKNKVCIIGIQPGNTSYGRELSPEVIRSFPNILEKIKMAVQ